jgi:hypothetical protein
VDVMERPSREKMPLDEATFQRLLAAAHVLQEHADQTKSQPPVPELPTTPDQAAVLAEIVETQEQILLRRLDLSGAMKLVAERVRKLSGAKGVAIGLLNKDRVLYRAGSGSATGLVGLELQAEATVSADTLLHGKILRCTDIDSELRIDPNFARERGIQSLIAVPLFHEGHIAGVMELLFSERNSFQEQSVRTAQLMAGLLSEALARDAEERWRKDVAQERASMLEALEKIRPQLARLIDVPEGQVAEPEEGTGTESSPKFPHIPMPAVSDTSRCSECGDPLGEDEFFCASCGTARPEPPEAKNALAAALGSLPSSTPAAQESASLSNVASSEGELASAAKAQPATEELALPDDVLAIAGLPAASEHNVVQETTTVQAQPGAEPVDDQSTPEEPHDLIPMAAAVQAPTYPKTSYPWTSARKAADWLNSLAAAQKRSALLQFWRSHSGDISLGVAVTLVLAAALFWGFSSHDNPATGTAGDTAAASSAPANAQAPQTAQAPQARVRRKRLPPPPKLTLFERMLVSMGLAEAPPAPEYVGNPDVTVWVDLQTALYYCPGSDMYGKTPKGKLETQRDAQMDQFEPAFRKVCD